MLLAQLYLHQHYRLIQLNQFHRLLFPCLLEHRFLPTRIEGDIQVLLDNRYRSKLPKNAIFMILAVSGKKFQKIIWYIRPILKVGDVRIGLSLILENC